jgi:hypothetical protein
MPEDSPHFGPDGQILYRSFDGTNNYLEQMNRDGSGRSRVVPYPSATSGLCLRTAVGSPLPERCRMASEAPLRCPSREALPSESVRAQSRGLLMGSSSICLCRIRHALILAKHGLSRYSQARCYPSYRLQECELWTNQTSFPALTSSTHMESRPVWIPPSTRT